MKFDFRACARALCAALAVAAGTSAPAAAPLTLEEAWRIAETASPQLGAAEAELSAARGQLEEARAPLWNNPELSLEGTRTRTPRAPAPGNRANGWLAGLSQTFEIAGQQTYRRDAAEAELAAVEAGVGEARRRLWSDVEQRFVQVLALQSRAEVERESLAVIERAAGAVAKRLAAGETGKLDANLARVEAERARNALVQIDEQLTQARADLASLLQLPPAELPEVTGELGSRATYGLEELVEAASRRPRLESLSRQEEAARGRLALERAKRNPDVTVGLFGGRDGPSDLRESVLGLSVSLPLPLFRRNEAGIGRAAADLAQARIERRAAIRDAAADVRAQWQRAAQLESRAARLRESVLPALEENRRLSRLALDEGEIGIAELILVNRQVADVRRELLEAQAELRRARIALERAAGWVPEYVKGRQ